MNTPEQPHSCDLSFEDTAIAFAGKDNNELKKSVRLFSLMGFPPLVAVGSRLTRLALHLRLPVEGLVRATIFEQFCGGTSIQECIPSIKKLMQFGVHTILDYGVEAKEEESELELAAQKLVKTIRYAQDDPDTNIISSKITGLIRFDLLVKVSSGEALSGLEQQEYIRGRKRVKFLCKNAFESDVQVYFDAEESWIQPAIDRIVTEMMSTYNKKKAIIFNTVQMYRHDRLVFLKESVKKARDGNYFYGVKVVRGAYMEKERARAGKMEYPSPIQPDKASTDRDFNAGITYCLENLDIVSFCNATHNEESCLLLCAQLEDLEASNTHEHIMSAQLFGMSDHISFNMAKAGFNVAKYMPYGPVDEVIPYLLRRAQENTSVGGQVGRELKFLREEKTRRGI